MESKKTTITPIPLTQESFKNYGTVISLTHNNTSFTLANLGTAKRHNYITNLVNMRPEAKLNICTFHISPKEKINGNIEITLLERHLYSSQMFVPTSEGRYLVIVGNNNDEGEVEVLIGDSSVGVCYNPGCWHHPMITLDGLINFLCLVYEDGTEKDCEEKYFEKILINLS